MSLDALIHQLGIYEIYILFLFLFLFFILIYYFVFKNFIINKFDPAIIQLLIIIVPASAGYLLNLFNFFTISSMVVVVFIFTFLLLIKLCSLKHISLVDSNPQGFQILILVISVFIMLVDFYLNMFITGDIPLFSDALSAGRFSSTENSRLLTWLSGATSNIPIFIYSISKYSLVRKLSFIGSLLTILKGVLFASKGALFVPIFIVLSTLCISKAQGDVNRVNYFYDKLIKLTLFTILSGPIYLFVIGFADTASDFQGILFLIINRLFLGFDQLIPASNENMISNAFIGIEDFGLNLFQYQLMPFVKALFELSPNFSSIGQYVVLKTSGVFIDKAFTFPNSNLILECVVTSGYIVGYILFFTELFCLFMLRRYVISRPITPLSFSFVYCLYLDPFGLFISGQEFVNNFVLSVLIIWFVYFVYYIILRIVEYSIVTE